MSTIVYRVKGSKHEPIYKCFDDLNQNDCIYIVNVLTNVLTDKNKGTEIVKLNSEKDGRIMEINITISIYDSINSVPDSVDRCININCYVLETYFSANKLTSRYLSNSYNMQHSVWISTKVYSFLDTINIIIQDTINNKTGLTLSPLEYWTYFEKST